MIRVHVICEGDTEETFIDGVIAPHFQPMAIYVSPSKIGEPGKKGGGFTFERLFLDVRNRLLGDKTAYCTTFFDFYALPKDFPGKADAAGKVTVKDKSAAVCEALSTSLQARLGDQSIRKFIPYVQMYEFEALLFSDVQGFARGIYRPDIVDQLQEIRDAFDSPEEINDSVNTAPSKRILKLVPKYEKPTFGSLAALEIGLPAMRRECSLFHLWLKRLEILIP